jgi:hypothetical protein
LLSYVAREHDVVYKGAAVTPLVDGRRGVGLTVKIDRINQTIKRARLADLVAARTLERSTCGTGSPNGSTHREDAGVEADGDLDCSFDSVPCQVRT